MFHQKRDDDSFAHKKHYKKYEMLNCQFLPVLRTELRKCNKIGLSEVKSEYLVSVNRHRVEVKQKQIQKYQGKSISQNVREKNNNMKILFKMYFGVNKKNSKMTTNCLKNVPN